MQDSSSSTPIDDPARFRELMRAIREGSEDAAQEVFTLYQGHVFRAVRRILKPSLRSILDSGDFVQRVFLSFFRVRENAGRFETSQQLVKFLAGMVGNKVQMEMRHRLGTQRYGIGRQVPFHEALGEDDPNAVSPEPDPVDVAIADEKLEQILRDLPPHYRQIIHFKRKGFTCAEIGTILDLNEETVRRFLKKHPMASE